MQGATSSFNMYAHARSRIDLRVHNDYKVGKDISKFCMPKNKSKAPSRQQPFSLGDLFIDPSDVINPALGCGGGWGGGRTPLAYVFSEMLKPATRNTAVFGTPIHESFPHILRKFRPRSFKARSPGNRVASPQKKVACSS